MIRALYDTEAGALAIDLEEPAGQAVHGSEAIPGLIVAQAADGRVVSVETLDPGASDLEDRLIAASGRFGLDSATLIAAARAALAVPDREVSVEVAGAA